MGMPPFGSSDQNGDVDDNDAGSEIYLNDKGIHVEVIFLNLGRPRGGLPVTAEIMAGRAQYGCSYTLDVDVVWLRVKSMIG